MALVHVLITLESSNKWPFFQMDVNNAFLNGNLYEEVYICLPTFCRILKIMLSSDNTL